jgi:hypothetical protein
MKEGTLRKVPTTKRRGKLPPALWPVQQVVFGREMDMGPQNWQMASEQVRRRRAMLTHVAPKRVWIHSPGHSLPSSPGPLEYY